MTDNINKWNDNGMIHAKQYSLHVHVDIHEWNSLPNAHHYNGQLQSDYR